MQSLIGILAFVLMLSIIVVIHEFGHFIVARHFGVYCHEFSIGMGPAIYQHQGKQTMFSIRAIPLGGYVMMAGEEDGSQDEETDWLKNVPADQRLNNKKTWQQVLIMLAGVTMNFILAWCIYVGVQMNRGYVVEPALPIVYQVNEGSPAEAAGLKEGDEIVKITCGDHSLEPETQSELLEFIQFYHDELTLTVKRGDETVTLYATPEYNEEVQGYLLGFVSQTQTRKTAWYEAFGIATKDMIQDATTIYRSLGHLIKGEGLENLSGPVGIYNVTSQATQYGLQAYLILIAMISLNIGIFNLLPLPALDGGRIVIVLLEKALGHKIDPKIIETIIVGSFVLLIGLMLFATYNDLLRFF